MPASERVVLAYLKACAAEKKEMRTKELSMGKIIEIEHRDLYEILANFLQEHNLKMPVTEDAFYEIIARAHLRELPDYYTRLKKMEEEGETHLKARDKDA